MVPPGPALAHGSGTHISGDEKVGQSSRLGALGRGAEEKILASQEENSSPAGGWEEGSQAQGPKDPQGLPRAEGTTGQGSLAPAPKCWLSIQEIPQGQLLALLIRVVFVSMLNYVTFSWHARVSKAF